MQQVSDKETKIILDAAKEALRVEGDFVEFGCYKGDTSILLQRLLCQNGQNRRLWLYDSFAGLPEKTREDASVAGDNFQKGELEVTKKEVVLKFKKSNLPIPKIKKAFFEDLSAGENLENGDINPSRPGDLPLKIAFAFLDGDLYSSIKTSLNLVLPRLTKNAVLLIHDYNNPSLPGVAKAVDERSLEGTIKETLFIKKY
ncbi:class I SAM-dependent methyltransferase [Candidatus Saccharibacteria bacterium]|nr:class I SAM-dependent methyltransferase [Candidatus Saccharibacteria bacterium]